MRLLSYSHLFILLISICFISCKSKSARKFELENQPKEYTKTYDEEVNSERKITNHDYPNQDFTIASWNLHELGGSKSDSVLNVIAEILTNFDIIAIQEVVAKDIKGAQTVAELHNILNTKGSKWDYRLSDQTNSPSAYKSERYAFFWQTSKVNLVGGRPELDKSLEEVCDREPYIGIFETNQNKKFRLINFHSRPHDNYPEMEVKHFKKYFEKNNPYPTILAGDFNLDENHTVWIPFYKRNVLPTVRASKTTLKRDCISDYLSHMIDNIYYDSGKIKLISGQTFDFVEDCNNLYQARKISDHLPVFGTYQFIE